MMKEALEYLLAGISKMDELRDYLEGKCGKSLVVTANPREAVPPSVVVVPSAGEYPLNGGRGTCEATVILVLPLFDSLSAIDACTVADLFGETLYQAAGRGDRGMRLQGVTLAGLEMDDGDGLWTATFSISIAQ